MQIDRHYTEDGKDPLETLGVVPLAGDDGITRLLPAGWDGAAVEVLVTSVLYPAPLPPAAERMAEDRIPLWLRRATPATTAAEGGESGETYETDVRDVFRRIAGGLTYHAQKSGLFDTEGDARAFHDEFIYMMAHRLALPEIALMAAAGLDWAYGLPCAFRPAESIGGFGLAEEAAPAALLVTPDDPRGQILRRLRIQAETAALDGAPSPVVTLPVENIDSLAFIRHRRQDDIARLSQDVGAAVLRTAMRHVIAACDRDSVFGFDPRRNPRLKQAMADARASGATDAALYLALSYARQGYEDVDLGLEEGGGMEAPAWRPILSVPDDFIETALTGHGFMMVEAGAAHHHAPAQKLLEQVAEAVWTSGEPAIFFRDAARRAEGAVGPAAGGGMIYLAGTAAPGGTVDALRFAPHTGPVLDVRALAHAARIMTVALEASFGFCTGGPLTQETRPLALGLSGLPSVLMAAGVAYDSDSGRSLAAVAAAVVSGAAHLASADMADTVGAFDRYGDHAKEYLQTLRAAQAELSPAGGAKLSRRRPQFRPHALGDDDIAAFAASLWDAAYAKGKEQGFRHGHLSAMATAADMQALLGLRTRDIAPESALVVFEGGGAAEGLYARKLNPMVPRGLQRLGYTPRQIDDIDAYAVGHGTLLDAPGIDHGKLRQRGFDEEALLRLEAALQQARHIRHAFGIWTLGADFCETLPALSGKDIHARGFDMLAALGFSEDDVDAANLHCCGQQTLEGAPHLKPQHLSVFDVAAATGTGAVRRVSAEAQLKLQAAVEAFLSGAVNHTLPLDHYAAIDDVQKLVLSGWELGVKVLRLYRDSSSLLHPVILPDQVVAEEAVKNENAAASAKPKGVPLRA